LSSLIEFSCVGRVEAVKAVCLSQYGYNARLFQAVNFESMTYKYTMLALAFTVLAACERSAPPPDLAAEAQRIANESIIVDTHIDVPYRLDEAPAATDGGDFDYPRARAGGLNAAFMSIYTPAKLEAEGQSREKAEQLIDLVEDIVSSSAGKFAVATSPGRWAWRTGRRWRETLRTCSTTTIVAFAISPWSTACRITFPTPPLMRTGNGTGSASSGWR
jgi:hypothetical protein